MQFSGLTAKSRRPIAGHTCPSGVSVPISDECEDESDSFLRVEKRHRRQRRQNQNSALGVLLIASAVVTVCLMLTYMQRVPLAHIQKTIFGKLRSRTPSVRKIDPNQGLKIQAGVVHQGSPLSIDRLRTNGIRTNAFPQFPDGKWATLFNDSYSREWFQITRHEDDTATTLPQDWIPDSSVLKELSESMAGEDDPNKGKVHAIATGVGEGCSTACHRRGLVCSEEGKHWLPINWCSNVQRVFGQARDCIETTALSSVMPGIQVFEHNGKQAKDVYTGPQVYFPQQCDGSDERSARLCACVKYNPDNADHVAVAERGWVERAAMASPRLHMFRESHCSYGKTNVILEIPWVHGIWEPTQNHLSEMNSARLDRSQLVARLKEFTEVVQSHALHPHIRSVTLVANNEKEVQSFTSLRIADPCGKIGIKLLANIDRRVTYADMLNLANELFPNELVWISNADIGAGMGFEKLKHLAKNEMIAMSRHPPPHSGRGEDCFQYVGSHDGFFFYPPVPVMMVENSKFQTNRWGAENTMIDNFNAVKTRPKHRVLLHRW